MIITLYGQDLYRRKKKLDELTAGFLKKNSNLTFEIIDASEEDSMQKMQSFLTAQSLFQDFKLIVIKNALSELNHSRLKLILKNATDDKVIVIISDENDKITKDIQFLTIKPNLTQEFSKLSPIKFTEFIREEAKTRNVRFEEKALDYLSKAFNGDSWGVVEELNKLALMDGSPIGIDILKKNGISIEYDFFGYISGWFRKSIAERLLSFERLLDARNDPAKIFNILAYQDQSQLRRFADYDVEIKSGKLEYEEALLELALI